MKATIELNLSSAKLIGSLCTLAKLFELFESEKGGVIDYSEDYELWGRDLPIALDNLAGAIEFLITAYEHDMPELSEIFGFSDEWNRLRHVRFTLLELGKLKKTFDARHIKSLDTPPTS